jgi:histidinol phosphatase-like PHP family hydrolase
MKMLDKVAIERDELKMRVENLVSLLREANETVDIAIGVELEYADYDSVERLKRLRQKIELEVKSCK